MRIVNTDSGEIMGASDRSDEIGELAAALAKAQGVMTAAAMDRENPFFNSKYADLHSVWEACRGPLSSNGLAVIQRSEANGTQVVVETILAHSSGQWIAASLALQPKKDDPQGVGSALSYARRYGLAAMVGISQADDDANSASGKDTKAAGKTKAAPASKESGKKVSDKANSAADTRTITQAQRKLLWAKATAKHGRVKAESAVRVALSTFGLEHTDDLPRTKLDDAITIIEAMSIPDEAAA